MTTSRNDLQKTIADSIALLCAETDAAKQSDTYKAWLSAVSRFHRYSFANCLLIYSQRADATRVAGFHTWKSLGRFVRKGESGIRIIAPIVVKANGNEEKGEDKCALLGYRAVCVFDVSQTDGQSLPALETLAKEGGDQLLPRLEGVAAHFSIALTYRNQAIDEGASMGGAIEIEASLSPSARCGVLAHELAHELMHWQKATPEQRTKQQMELEAESVAYVVLQHFGMKVDSKFYLAGYGVNSEMLAASLPAISATASRIIARVESAAQPGEEDAGETGDSFLLAA